jgi:hypothetical protein
MEVGAENDTVALLAADKCRWDVVFIQEGPAREAGSCTIIDSGHALYVGKPGPNKRTACILLNRRWASAKSSFHAVTDRVSYLDVEIGSLSARLTCAHLPHAEIHEDVYESVLASVEEILVVAWGKRRVNIIGIDANAVIGNQSLTETNG